MSGLFGKVFSQLANEVLSKALLKNKAFMDLAVKTHQNVSRAKSKAQDAVSKMETTEAGLAAKAKVAAAEVKSKEVGGGLFASFKAGYAKLDAEGAALKTKK